MRRRKNYKDDWSNIFSFFPPKKKYIISKKQKSGTLSIKAIHDKKMKWSPTTLYKPTEHWGWARAVVETTLGGEGGTVDTSFKS